VHYGRHRRLSESLSRSGDTPRVLWTPCGCRILHVCVPPLLPWQCAWNFNATYTATNGGVANVKLGARDYLIQSNWVNRPGAACAIKFP
jgi:hypothetical protein